MRTQRPIERAGRQDNELLGSCLKYGTPLLEQETDCRHLALLGGRGLVESAWLLLLSLVRLPKLVNPVELVRLTTTFFDEIIWRANDFEEFPAQLEELSLNRAHIEELVGSNPYS